MDSFLTGDGDSFFQFGKIIIVQHLLMFSFFVIYHYRQLPFVISSSTARPLVSIKSFPSKRSFLLCNQWFNSTGILGLLQ